MRLIFDPQPRPRTRFVALRLALATCLAVLFFAQPVAAESNPDDVMPKGLDAQPQPVYPDGRLEATATTSEAESKRRAPRPTAEELEAALTGESATGTPKKEGSASEDLANEDSISEDLASEDLADVEAPIEPKTPIIVASIDKTSQEMTVFVDGVEEHRWPVSTGMPGYATPSGTFNTTSMNEIWYSRQWNNTPMPHAVFFTKKGHAVHATDQVKKLGQPASKGCVRLSPKHAETFFSLVKAYGLERTEVVLTGSTPGGDYKIAHPDRRYDPYFEYGRPGYPRYAPNRNYRRYGYNEIRPRAERRRRAFQPRNQQRRYRRAPRRGNWFRAPGY